MCLSLQWQHNSWSHISAFSTVGNCINYPEVLKIWCIPTKMTWLNNCPNSKVSLKKVHSSGWKCPVSWEVVHTCSYVISSFTLFVFLSFGAKEKKLWMRKKKFSWTFSLQLERSESVKEWPKKSQLNVGHALRDTTSPCGPLLICSNVTHS